MLKYLERKIRDSSCSNINKERGRQPGKQMSCSREFQKRRSRRHTNIPNSLPWLDNTAAKGKVLFSSVFRDQR